MRMPPAIRTTTCGVRPGRTRPGSGRAPRPRRPRGARSVHRRSWVTPGLQGWPRTLLRGSHVPAPRIRDRCRIGDDHAAGVPLLRERVEHPQEVGPAVHLRGDAQWMAGTRRPAVPLEPVVRDGRLDPVTNRGNCTVYHWPGWRPRSLQPSRRGARCNCNFAPNFPTPPAAECWGSKSTAPTRARPRAGVRLDADAPAARTERRRRRRPPPRALAARRVRARASPRPSASASVAASAAPAPKTEPKVTRTARPKPSRKRPAPPAPKTEPKVPAPPVPAPPATK